MSFKKLRGVKLPEWKQGLIHYTCLNIGEQPQRLQRRFERLCVECGGAHWRALRELLTSERSVTGIALEHHVSEGALYRARGRFYERWQQEEGGSQGARS